MKLKFWRFRYAFWFCFYTHWSPRRCWQCAKDVPDDMTTDPARDVAEADVGYLLDSQG